MKGFKLCDPALRKQMYNRDVVFREVGGTSKYEGVHIEKDSKKARFEV
jgi:hypothetical protein